MASMPVLLVDWLVRYRLESMLGSLARDFKVTTTAHLLHASEAKVVCEWVGG
jgi:hypothetical protein